MDKEDALKKTDEIFQLICKHTYPRDQFGFFTEEQFLKLIYDIIVRNEKELRGR